MKVPVPIAPYWVARSRAFGKALADWYASPQGRCSRSRSRSGERGTESNPLRLGMSKVGEVAVALFFGMAPERTIKWTVGEADDGTDLLLPIGGLRVDVKTTETWKRYLLWSNNVNDLYASKRFDLLIGASVFPYDWSRCSIEGYISKGAFFQRKRTADGVVSPELEPGTWHLRKSDLIDIRQIWRVFPRAEREEEVARLTIVNLSLNGELKHDRTNSSDAR